MVPVRSGAATVPDPGRMLAPLSAKPQGGTSHFSLPSFVGIDPADRGFQQACCVATGHVICRHSGKTPGMVLFTAGSRMDEWSPFLNRPGLGRHNPNPCRRTGPRKTRTSRNQDLEIQVLSEIDLTEKRAQKSEMYSPFSFFLCVSWWEFDCISPTSR